MAGIVTIGEIVSGLSAPNNEKFIQADKLDTNYGGGEANMAVSPVNYGHEAEFITAVPTNPTGECTVAALRKCNVSVKHIARGSGKLGTYFLETGSAMRASDVVYDHAHSSVSTAIADQFSFNEIFTDVDWLHSTGVTPAVSDATIELTEAALKAAKAYNVAVSVDLDFRKKLWSPGEAQKVMTNLMQHVDVCIGNEGDVEKALGFKSGNADAISGELELAGYVDIFNQMADKLGSKYITSSLRESHSASDNGWSTCIMDGRTREFYHSREYHTTPIIGRVSGGDPFVAGLICGLVDGRDMKTVLEHAVAASALKRTIPGGFNLVTRVDVENLVGGDGSGRIQK